MISMKKKPDEVGLIANNEWSVIKQKCFYTKIMYNEKKKFLKCKNSTNFEPALHSTCTLHIFFLFFL